MQKIILCLFLFITAVSTYAQHPPRPKIGLVLSGGGAKGYAHVGVIKVLEEAGVKIDYIAGTSMGAIIGGVYASGYNAKQLDSIFQLADPDAIINDYTIKSSRISADKNFEEKYAITLPVKDFNIKFPLAYSKGLYNYNFLSEMTFNVRHIQDFNKLPIPFVCVAQDIETGEEVVLNKGNLAKAMVASSSFPSLFYPVKIDGRKLVDGGVINNFPVEELRKMGADIVIGINVQDDLQKNPGVKGGGATAVVMQIANFEMAHKMKDKEKLVDIYIKPDISQFTFFSFREGREIISAGEEAALKMLPQLQNLIDPTQSIVYKPRLKTPDSVRVNRIYIDRLQHYNSEYVIGKLGFKPNTKIPIKKLYEGIIELNATKNFKQIDYHLDQQDNLYLDLTENEDNTFLRVGLHYDPVFKSGVLLNLTHKHLFLTNDVLSFDLVLGDSYRWLLDYYVDNGYNWSFGSRARYTNFNYNVKNDFNNGKTLERLGIQTANIDYNDVSVDAYAQTVLFKKFYSSAGLEGRYLKVQSNTLGNIQGLFENDILLNAYGKMSYDGLDKSFFPTKGWFFKGKFDTYLVSSRFLLNFEPFYIASADMGFVQPLSKKVSLMIQSEGGFTIQNEVTPYLNFFLGGYGYKMINSFRHFYGYDFFTLTGDSYVKGAITLDYEFKRRHHLNLVANFSNIGNDIFESGEWITSPDYSGYAIGYGYETFFGPIELKHSWSPETGNQFSWVSLGYRF